MDFAQALSSGADALNNINGIAQYNTAQSQAMAERQMEFQTASNAAAMAFNRIEAEKTRNWQTYLSNTAHQREVRDLRAAGLNPVLSAMGGNGAAVGSGATAQGVTSSGAKGSVDTSTNAALVGLLGSILSNTQQLEAANINARTQESVADKYTAMSKLVAQIGAAASISSANIHAGATRYAAAQSSASNKYSADKHLEGVKYSSDQSKAASDYHALASLLGTEYASDVSYAGKMAELDEKFMQNASQLKIAGYDLSGIARILNEGIGIASGSGSTYERRSSYKPKYHSSDFHYRYK